MTKLMIEIEDDVADELLRRAKLLGISLEQAVSDVVARNRTLKSRTGWLAEFIKVSERSNANLGQWTWNRDEIHER
jgi:hypothetical protein